MELVSSPCAGGWSPSKVLVQILQMPMQPVEYAPSCLEPRCSRATPVMSHSGQRQGCLPVTALSPVGDFLEVRCRNKLRSNTSTERTGFSRTNPDPAPLGNSCKSHGRGGYRMQRADILNLFSSDLKTCKLEMKQALPIQH